MKKENRIIDKVTEHFGSSYSTAKNIGITPQLYYSWQKKGFIPFKYGKRIEAITNGIITAMDIWQEAGRYH